MFRPQSMYTQEVEQQVLADFNKELQAEIRQLKVIAEGERAKERESDRERHKAAEAMVGMLWAMQVDLGKQMEVVEGEGEAVGEAKRKVQGEIEERERQRMQAMMREQVRYFVFKHVMIHVDWLPLDTYTPNLLILYGICRKTGRGGWRLTEWSKVRRSEHVRERRRRELRRERERRGRGTMREKKNWLSSR